jgi:hypothetical protein
MFTDDKAHGEAQRINPTVRGLLDFASKRLPHQAYDYIDSCHCACQQYAEEIGDLDAWYSRNDVEDSPWARLDFVAACYPQTYGALAERLREIECDADACSR